MLLTIHPEHPQPNRIAEAVRALQSGGVIIFPTETAYHFGASVHSKEATAHIYRLKKIDVKQPLTFICKDYPQFISYASGVPGALYSLFKKHLPGPYTFLFKASKVIPKGLHSARSTIGIRIPSSNIARALADKLEAPLLCSSVPIVVDEEEKNPLQKPAVLYEQYKKVVALVIDGGEIHYNPSTIIDFSHGEPELVRLGAGDPSWLIPSEKADMAKLHKR